MGIAEDIEKKLGIHTVYSELLPEGKVKLIKAIKISRKTMKIVYENIAFSILLKVISLFLVASGVAGMWLAIFADVGVMILTVLNATRTLFVKKL